VYTIRASVAQRVKDLLLQEVKSWKESQAFGSVPLLDPKIALGTRPGEYRIDIKDHHCPFANRTHARTAAGGSSMYILITRKGAFYKCHDTECQHKRLSQRKCAPISNQLQMILKSERQEIIPFNFEADDISKEVIQQLYDPFADDESQTRLVEYLNSFIGIITKSANPHFVFRESTQELWIDKTDRGLREAMKEFNFTNIDSETGRSYKVDVLNLWAQNDRRRKFRSVEFNPTQDGDYGDTMNLFTGLKAQYLEDPDLDMLQPLFKFLKEVFAAGDEKVFQYLLAWQAQLVQEPDKKLGVTLNFISPQGCGKNLFWEEFFGDLVIGEKYYNISFNIASTIGRFNSQSATTLLQIHDEARTDDARASYSQMKSMITGKHIRVEKKFCDPQTVRSYTRFVTLTNDEKSVIVEGRTPNDDRRTFVQDLASTYQRNSQYFDDLCSKILTTDMANAYFTFLRNFDLSTVNLREIPETAARKRIRAYNEKPLDRFIDDLLCGLGDILSKRTLIQEDEKFKTYKIDLDELHARFLSYDKSMQKDLFSRELNRTLVARGMRVKDHRSKRNQTQRIRFKMITVNVDRDYEHSETSEDDEPYPKRVAVSL
jgi:hypothetical protein